jgi:hypothetical protein
MYCIELSRYVLYGPILPSGIAMSHFAPGSFGRQRSSDSWNTSITLTILNPSDSNRRTEGVLAVPILASRLCGLIPIVEIAYERLSSALACTVMRSRDDSQKS